MRSPTHISLLFSVIYIFVVLNVFHTNVSLVTCAPQYNHHVCDHSMKTKTSTFFRRRFDASFWKKFFMHWIPFVGSSERVKMRFFLYKRDFPECGRELRIDDDENLLKSGFDANHPTRIIIHGWMSQSKGSFNRAVKNAYMKLTRPKVVTDNNGTATNETIASNLDTNFTSTPNIEETVDFNVIVVDWSVISTNVNYFSVVELIEDLGFLLAQFVRYLQMRAGLYFGDVYLIGHSLGAQIAGSAGKQVKPFRFNTIFALDPAGPKFRNVDDDHRIDASDADYVESIQTSSSLGFEEPVGHATFYPNFGRDQKKCYMYSCSHSRAHKYFAESITSQKGFWGTLCQRQSHDVWILSDSGEEFRMGGEPSTPKNGTFYVRTNGKPPYALGRRIDRHLSRAREEFKRNLNENRASKEENDVMY